MITTVAFRALSSTNDRENSLELHKLSPAELGYTLIWTIKNNIFSIVEKIIFSKLFSKLLNEHLEECLIESVKKDKFEIVQHIINSSKFKDLSIESIGQSLNLSLENNSFLIFQLIYHSFRFSEISERDIQISLITCATFALQEPFLMLIETISFKKMSSPSFSWICDRLADLHNPRSAKLYMAPENQGRKRTIMMKSFIFSGKFEEISEEELVWIITHIIQNSQNNDEFKKMHTLVMCTDRIKKFNKWGNVLELIAGNATGLYHPGFFAEKQMKEIIGTKKFDKVYLEEALKNAAYYGNNNLIKVILNCHRFKEISKETLKVASRNTRINFSCTRNYIGEELLNPYVGDECIIL
jgi:hypothetical protein